MRIKLLFLFTTVVGFHVAASPLTAENVPSHFLSASNTKAALNQPGLVAKHIGWAGFGAYRLLIAVEPFELHGRSSDELPAQVEIDWVSLLKSVGVPGKADLRSLQVMQIDPKSGNPVLYSDYAYQRSPYDRAFCWYDGAIPYAFPEVLAPASHTAGKRRRQVSVRGGYMYNAVGDWKSGKLAWSHTQTGNNTSYYAVYFDRMDTDALPPEAPPRGWIGDAMPRHARWGESTTGADTTQIDLDDWNGDGLFDIVYGEQYGQLFVMLNTGTRTKPAFGPSRMLFESDGQPLDVGVHAAPLVVDWDGDGVKDLLIGTYQNRIAFFHNTGTNAKRQFKYEGFLRDSTGDFLALPVTPVAKKSPGVFKEDYFPVLAAVDWDHDGKLDLLCGGYITGRVYFYRNTGRKDGAGLPLLKLVGPLADANGEPINVRDWCAAPCVADFNGDGLPDLVVGAYTWRGEKVDRPSFLRYFVNKGAPGKPILEEKELPVRGKVPQLRLPHPRAFDCNGDGLVDLVVSSGSDIIIYPNVGTKMEPLFDIDQKPIRTAWGSAPAKVEHQVLDWNKDGWPDLVTDYTIRLNARIGKPYFWNKTAPVLPDGMRIDHPVKLGDGHFYPYLHDLDHDGKPDVLFGDWFGHVWFHRNLNTASEKQFDEQGKMLMMSDGAPITVGPIHGDTKNDFQALQGARTTLVAGDFNGDGLDDLIVGDTYGKVRYFENVGPQNFPRFKEPVLIGDLKSRCHVDRADWNHDGKLDVIASVSAHKIYVILNDGSPNEAHFAHPIPLNLEIKNPIAMAVDLNRDGDVDLLVNGTQGTSFAERSYIEHGYARARVLQIEFKTRASEK